MTDYETLLVDHSDNVLTITLNRPDKLNVLTHKMGDEIKGLLKKARRDDSIRAVLMTGAGRGFCAGQDLSDMSVEPGTSLRRHLQQGYNPMISAMRALEKPIITAINGVTVGAGLGLALAGDIRYAAENAIFRIGFIGIGLMPDCGVSFFLPRLIGPARAAAMTFTNDAVSATQAEQWGLINQVCPPDDLLPAARELAVRLAGGPTKAIGLSKRALNRAQLIDIDTALEYEAQLQDIAGRTADFREGVMAFIEKRAPQYTGS